MHRQSTWRERAMDFNRPLPLWMRVAFMGYAHHQSNGHASFAKGELFKEFSTAAGSALVPRKLSEKQLYNALADAKEYGYLDGRSSLRCLIVPPSSVCGGLNDLRAPCGYCDGRKTGRRK
jgi:hypothetical protein